MLGGLHIEMVIFSMLGKLLDGSGWCKAITDAGITTSGKAKALISASHVKHTSYAHQVTVAALHELKNLHISTTLNQMTLDDEWSIKMTEEHPKSHYWSMVMEIEICMLQYV